MKAFAAILGLLLVTSCSQDRQPEISVSGAWARPTITPTQTGVVYLTVTNTGSGEDRLEGVSVDGGQASLHETSMTDGIMRMRPLAEGIAIPGNSVVELKPNGLHIMLEGRKTALKSGTGFPVVLRFAKSGERTAQVQVQDGPVDHSEGHR